MRTIVIGDVHGCLAELDELLRKVERRGTDRLIFAGDLLDRGPDPVGVVRRARELGAESVMGNHEEKHLRYRNHEMLAAGGGGKPTGYKNPMRPYHGDRLAQHRALREEDWSYIQAMPLLIRVSPKWVVVHAGLQPSVALAEQSANVLLRMRYLVTATGKMLKLGEEEARPGEAAFWSTVWTGPESVVYGHHVQRVAVDEPASGVRCVGIDTGCCFGRALTAAIFIDGELRETVEVLARETYCERGDVE